VSLLLPSKDDESDVELEVLEVYLLVVFSVVVDRVVWPLVSTGLCSRCLGSRRICFLAWLGGGLGGLANGADPLNVEFSEEPLLLLLFWEARPPDLGPPFMAASTRARNFCFSDRFDSRGTASSSPEAAMSAVASLAGDRGGMGSDYLQAGAEGVRGFFLGKGVWYLGLGICFCARFLLGQYLSNLFVFLFANFEIFMSFCRCLLYQSCVLWDYIMLGAVKNLRPLMQFKFISD